MAVLQAPDLGADLLDVCDQFIADARLLFKASRRELYLRGADVHSRPHPGGEVGHRQRVCRGTDALAIVSGAAHSRSPTLSSVSSRPPTIRPCTASSSAARAT